LAGTGLTVLATLPLTLGGLVGVPTATAAASTPLCGTRDFSASIHPRGGGAAGSVYVRLVLRNTSGRACHTRGFPGVAYVGDGNGTQVGAPADRVHRNRVKTVRVPAGGRVVATLREIVAANYPRERCRPHPTNGLRVYPPNQTTSLFVPQTTTGCRNTAVHLLSVRPLHRPR
jgi:hypothetical protein